MSDILNRLKGWGAYGNGGPHPGVPAVRNEEAAAEIARLHAMVRELANEVEAQVMETYCDLNGVLTHPAYKRKYDRDIEIVLRARALIGEKDE